MPFGQVGGSFFVVRRGITDRATNVLNLRPVGRFPHDASILALLIMGVGGVSESSPAPPSSTLKLLDLGALAPLLPAAGCFPDT